jgi:GNAT superfamily N-acetyltransferase
MDYELVWANKKGHYAQVFDLLCEAFEANHNREPSERFLRKLHWALGRAITGQGEPVGHDDPRRERVKVARDENNNVLAMIWWTKTEAETDEARALIRALVVSEPYRRQGIAKALLKDAAEFCKERGIQVLDSILYMANEPIMQMAKDLGFRPEKVWFKKVVTDDWLEGLGEKEKCPLEETHTSQPKSQIAE